MAITVKRKVTAGMLFLCLLCFLIFFSAGASDSLKVHFLDVGQGLSILVESDDHVMMFDGGGRESSSFVVAYLKQAGIDKIDYIFASHYDEDHLAGLVGCIKVFDVGEVYGSDYYEDSAIYHSFMNAADEKGIDIRHPYAGETLYLGNAQVSILAPLQNYSAGNDNSLVVKLEYGQTSFLFTGDAEKSSEFDMISNGVDVSSDVLCIGHHGSYNSTSSVFLDQVQPKYALVSCGRGNSYGHPHVEVMEDLRTRGINVYRTDKQGTVIAESDGNAIYWQTEPCNDYSPGESVSEEVFTEAAEITAEEAVEAEAGDDYNYVLNTSKHKIHYPDCNSVKQMSDKNKLFFYGSKEDAVAMGYEPCKNCNP